jgi:hypothetical protein
MRLPIVEGWVLIFYFELIMHFRTLKRLHHVVSQTRPITQPETAPPYQEICRSIDVACVYYFKHVLCLQRSAATTLLLRRYGWNAEMVIGAKLVPFESHAWVEIDGCVVNDKPYVSELYQVLERC